MTTALIDHLWQTTLFAFGAGLLTLTLKANGARYRYNLWFAASIKFLIPFDLLASSTDWFARQFHPAAPAFVSLQAVRRVVETFSASAPTSTVTGPAFTTASSVSHAALSLSVVLMAVWATGATAVLIARFLSWWQVRAVLIASSPIVVDPQIATFASSTLLEPGVVGVFRQVLMIPKGIDEHLSPAEMKAILTHEFCHLRRRDNLTAAIHMLVEAIFWFHPLVWWIGGRLIAERERACDEDVINNGNDPRVYAEGILKVCRFYLQAPREGVAGASGSNLKKRIERIITGSTGRRLSASKAALMSAVAALALTGPVMAGLISALPATARTTNPKDTGYESTKPALSAANARAAVDGGKLQPTADVNSSESPSIDRRLKNATKIFTAPGSTLISAVHIDQTAPNEPLAAPELQMAALSAPQSSKSDDIGEAARSSGAIIAQASPPIAASIVDIKAATVPAPQACSLKSHGLSGTWVGMVFNGIHEEALILHISADEKGVYSAKIDSPDRSAMGIQTKNFSVIGKKIKFEFPDIVDGYSGSLTPSGSTIEGRWRMGDHDTDFHFVRCPGAT